MCKNNHDDFPSICLHCNEEVENCVCDGGGGSPFYTDEELQAMKAGRQDAFEDYQGSDNPTGQIKG